MNVSLYLDSLAAVATTSTNGDGDRDEVYVIAYGTVTEKNGHGQMIEFASTLARLPRYVDDDDYYEFSAFQNNTMSDYGSWTNQDQAPVGPPIIWEGQLASGQSAQFTVIVAEQDNKNISDI
ncbi:MAG: hypothetical protein ACOYNY_47345, partial [Caldilineaceae bacterium]